MNQLIDFRFYQVFLKLQIPQGPDFRFCKFVEH